MIKNDRLVEQLAAIAAIVLLIIGCLYILAPFFGPLLWAAIITYCTWDLYEHQVRLLRGRRILSALIMTLLVLLVVVGPFAYAVVALVTQADVLSAIGIKLIDKGVPPLPGWVAGLPVAGPHLVGFWNGLLQGDPAVAAFIRDKLSAPFGQWLLNLGTSTGKGLLQMVLSIFLSFFFYTGGRTALAWLHGGMRRIAGRRGPHLLRFTGSTIKGVVYGTLGTALIQAVLAGIGYWIAGIPNPGIWGFATFFTSVLPVIGSGTVWVPAALWLYGQGEVGWSIFVLVWGALVVASADNVIKPLMISKGGGLPFVLVLLGVLGGVIAFGFLGVFIGPTLLAVGYSVLRDWTVGSKDEEAAPPRPNSS